MNRQARRAHKAAVTRAVKASDKKAMDMMRGPAGAWEELNQEQYQEQLGISLASSTTIHGQQRVPSQRLMEVEKAFFNQHYEVLLRPFTCEWGACTHLYVRRVDRKPIHSWTVLQGIKNELVSPSRAAVEVYPPADEVVDQAHWYHLWVLPEGFQLPFSLAK